jgi:hypothetical protein
VATEAEISDLKRRHSARLMARPEVSGVGVERDEAGGYVLAVHLASDDPALVATLPCEIEGYPIRYTGSGPYVRLAAEDLPPGRLAGRSTGDDEV